MQFLLAMTLLAAAPGAVVLKPVANMYSAASEQTDVVSQAIYGSPLVLLEEKNGWAQVQTPDEYKGWMPASSFRRGEYAARGRVAQVTSLFSNLYQEASVIKHQPLLTVPYETRLEAIAEPGDDMRWIQVRLVDGREAWVQRGDVAFDAPSMKVDEVIALSKRFLGLPYTWGGTSTFGYDCSGFTQMLLRRRGVLMPRDAQPQADWSGFAPVERAAIQPGDLLYFGKSDKKITHTGMYIGGGQFINATTHETPVVRIDNLEEPYWSKLLVAIRRLK